MIKAVLFDFDETLQDRTLAFESYMDAVLKKYFPDIDEKTAREYKNDMVQTGNGGYVVRVDWYQALLEKWGYADKLSAQELAEHYDTTFGDHNVIFEHTVPLLKELKKRGLLVGVITNGPSYLQNHKMDESGLREYCDIVVVSGDLGIHKPSPEIFELTAERLGLKCEECVYVGDHPINDIQGALSAGMSAIRMNWGWFKDRDLRSDVPVIDDIIDVLKYI